MKRVLLVGFVVVLAVVLVLGAGGAVRADQNPSGTGQPSQSCQAQSSSPGNAANAPGSAFNANGVAPSVYAGAQPQNSNNAHSVAQYDVACFQVSH